MTSPQPTIGNLSGTVQPVIDASNSALAQALMSTKDDKLASLLTKSYLQKPLTAPSAPNLTTQISAQTLPEGIMKGLSAGVGNIFQMRQYGQQQQRINQYEQQQRDLAQQFDLAMAQKAKAADLAAAAQAEQEAVVFSKLTPEAQATYKLLDDVGRREFLNKFAMADLGKFIGQGKGAEAKAAAPELGAAEATQQAAKIQGLTSVLQQSGVDINTPQGQNLFRALMQFEPTTQPDIDLKRAQATKAGVEADAAPMLTAQDIEQNTQNIQATKLGNVLKNIAIQFEPERLKSSIQGQQLTNAEKADKIQRVNTAMDIFNAFQERLERGEVTPEDIAQVQAQIGMLNGIDPSLDTTLKNMLGLKQDDSLTADKLKKFFQVQTAPPKPVTASPQAFTPPGMVRDLGTANKKLLAKAGQAGTKKREAQGKAKQVDQRIRQHQDLQSGYSKLEKDAKSQLNEVDRLLKKYSNIGPL